MNFYSQNAPLAYKKICYLLFSFLIALFLSFSRIFVFFSVAVPLRTLTAPFFAAAAVCSAPLCRPPAPPLSLPLPRRLKRGRQPFGTAVRGAAVRATDGLDGFSFAVFCRPVDLLLRPARRPRLSAELRGFPKALCPIREQGGMPKAAGETSPAAFLWLRFLSVSACQRSDRKLPRP